MVAGVARSQGRRSVSSSGHPATLPGPRERIRGVEPYRLNPAPPPLALLTDDGNLLHEDGVRRPLRKLDTGVQAWGSPDVAGRLLRQGRGKGIIWASRIIRYQEAGRSVRVAQLDFPDRERDSIGGLIAWRDWLAAYGAAPAGSIGGTSMSLLRATLAGPLWTSVPEDQCPPIGVTMGGRQELGPAGAPLERWGNVCHFDLRAAYASRLGALEYGGWWHRIHGHRLDDHAFSLHAAGKMVFCRARVRLAGTWPGPLVKRPRAAADTVALDFPRYPTGGELRGIWTLAELLSAERAGARFQLLDGWFHSNSGERPFAPWWQAIEEGRRLPGFAGVLAKATGNALWGQFVIRERAAKQLVFYRRERGGPRRVVVNLPVGGSRPPAHDLAEFLTGSVRAELLDFMVSAGPRLCSAHTDGGWVDVGVSGWRPPSDEWRLKERAEYLRVLDPQVLSYVRAGESEPRYVVSGWPAEGAAERFESDWRRAAA